MSKKVFITTFAVLVLFAAAASAQSALAFRPAQERTSSHAEGIYAEFTAATAEAIEFEVFTVESGSLGQIGGTPFGDLLAVPSFRVSVDEAGIDYRNPKFFEPEAANYGLHDMAFTVEDFVAVGYPVEMGRYRRLTVSAGIAGDWRNYEALELCWPELNHCTLVDPVVTFVESMVHTRLRLIVEGWGPKVDASPSPDKAVCRLSGHSWTNNYAFNWGGYWREYYNALGQTLVHKDLGAQQAGLRCNSSCYPAPYGYSYSSSCWGTLGWTCACDNKFGYGTTGTTGKWIAETKCTHSWVQSAKASASVQNQGSASVDITWTLGGGVDANGGQILDTCYWQ